VLGKGLYQAEEAALGVEPSVCTQLLLEGLQTLHDARDTESVVTLSAIQGADNQVNYTKMEYLSCWFLNSYPFFFLLKAFHQLFSIGILTCHNIADTKVSQNNGSYAQEVIHLSSHKRLVIPNGITILVLLQEENMGDIQFPYFMLTAEFSTLTENFLNH
jgi:hypothetical protein